jgi:rhodanese-related sulfurtransferase
MNRLKIAVLQAATLLMIGLIVSFAHNSFSVNGINPFREVDEVPVLNDPAPDARTKTEYEEGHIPGAILIDYYEMGRYLKEVLPTLDPSLRTIVYCYGPDCEDAELLARELYMLGFTDLSVYKGGYEDWVDSGGTIEGGADR